MRPSVGLWLVLGRSIDGRMDGFGVCLGDDCTRRQHIHLITSPPPPLPPPTPSLPPPTNQQVSGIITSASAVRARAVAVRVQCAMCHMVKVIPAQSGFGGIQIPTSCDGEDPNALADGTYAHASVCMRERQGTVMITVRPIRSTLIILDREPGPRRAAVQVQELHHPRR